MTSSRHSARPMATRSLIWRTLGSRLPAARTGADRSASNWRAIVRAGDGRVVDRGVRRSSDTLPAYGRPKTYATMHGRARVQGARAPTLASMQQLAFVFPGQGSQSVGM